jgi:hypothetical protein
MSLQGQIKFRITLNEITGKLLFEDISDTVYAGYASVIGAISISRNGVSVYKNPGFDTIISEPDTNIFAAIPVTFLEKEYTILKGVYEVNYRIVAVIGGVTEDFITTASYDFQSEAPTITVTRSVDYYLSKLTITDNSTYAINSGSFEPFLISRHLTLRPPLGIPADAGLAYDDVAEDVVTVGPDLYTNNYDLKIVSSLTYRLATWTDNDWWVIYITEAEYNDNFNIDYEESCITSCINCIRQLSERLILARSRSPRDAEYYERMIYDISFYYDLYLMYKSADLDASWPCEQIKSILRSECNVDITPSKNPVRIPATVLSGTNGVDGDDGATWLSGAGNPLASEGDNDDFYLKTTDGSVYKKVGGNWQFIMKLAVVGNRTIRTVTVSSLITTPDDIIYAEAVSVNVILNLPTPGPSLQGREFEIKAAILIRDVTVIPYSPASPSMYPGSPKINNQDSYAFKTQGDSIHVVLRNNNWEIH